MARYKEYSYEQTKLIPIAFSQQILPGTFEYTLNYLIDNEFDLSPLEQRSFRGAVMDAIVSATRRSQELGKGS